MLDYKERAILEQDELYLQKMARRKRGEEERVVVETNMGMANYLQRVLSAEFVGGMLAKAVGGGGADDDARGAKAVRERYRATPESFRARSGEVAEEDRV